MIYVLPIFFSLSPISHCRKNFSDLAYVQMEFTSQCKNGCYCNGFFSKTLYFQRPKIDQK